MQRPEFGAFSLAALALLAGCSTSFWHTQIQGAQFDKCEKLANADERRRCKVETSIDKDRYDKERKSNAGTTPGGTGPT